MANTQPKSLKGTQTEKNLLISYLAESAAYTRYTFYAQQAEKEQYYPVAKIFSLTADNELHHSKVYFKLLQGGTIQVPVTADSGVIADTASNLATAMEEEKTEGHDMYMAFAQVARQEGFDDIATHFESIAQIEKRHHDRFARYLAHVKDGTLWKRTEPVKWLCLVCGYVFEGTEPPKVCPACSHPYQHYMAIDPADEI